MQLSKKKFAKRKPQPDEGHWEGKHWCNCRTRNKRRYLGKKYYGVEDEKGHRHQAAPSLQV